jgi:hypothetical protein
MESTEEKKRELFKEWMKFKKAESAAENKRLEVEEQINLLYDFQETSKTFKEGEFNVNIKKNIKISLDQEKYADIRKKIPSDLRPEKVKFELDKAGFDYLKENEVEFYRLVSDCVSIKENKRTIKIEKK